MGTRELILSVMAVLGTACSGGDRTLFIVNATGTPGLSVLVDGKVVADKLGVATGLASAGGMKRVGLPPGAHKVSARDATGRVVEEQAFSMGKRSYGFLFAPGHRPDACFEVRTIAYGNYLGSTVPVRLPGNSTLWEMEHFIDQWFEASPEKVVVSKGQTGSHERAVVMVPCAPPAAPAP